MIKAAAIGAVLACLMVDVACGQSVQPTALVGGIIVDGAGGPPIPDGVLVLRGDRIEAVGPRASTRVPSDARQVDVTGKWLIPGLIDAHVHFSQSGGLYTRPDVLDLRTTVPYADDLAKTKSRLSETFARYLASGVTTVVDAGGPLWNFEVRSRANTGDPAPRVAVAGPLIATEPTPQQARLDTGDPPIISAASPEAAQALARAQLLRQPDLIKLWGIGSGPEGVERVRSITKAVVAVARPAGVRVAVHATSLALAKAAVDGGADILVHSVDDAPVDPEFVAALKAKHIVYVTTALVQEGYLDAFKGRPDLSIEERRLGAPDVIATLFEVPAEVRARSARRVGPSVLPQILANAKTLVQAGVRVAVGTDAGNIGTLHGPAIHRELELLAAAGLTPAQVLAAATRDAAYAYSPRPDVGLLVPGYRADLLVLAADPLVDVANLARIAQVWSRGQSYTPTALLPPSPEAVVQRQLERYNAHDLEGFAATYAGDLEIFESPGATRPSTAGKAALRQLYGQLFAKFPELNCLAAQRTVEGSYVIDQEVCRSRAQGQPVRATAIYQVERGVIRRVWFVYPE